MLCKAKELFKYNPKIRVMFAITEEDVQIIAEHTIGRKLTDDELYWASKGVEAGLSSGLDVVLQTAVEEAIQD